jgi:hypothetical protein
MNDGKTEGKHHVPRTDPIIWELDSGKSGKVYYRRDDSQRYVIELVGYKHHQEADYSRLCAPKVKTAKTTV